MGSVLYCQWQIQGCPRVSPLHPNSFIFMQFSAKIWQNNRLAHPNRELAPSRKSWIRHCIFVDLPLSNAYNSRGGSRIASIVFFWPKIEKNLTKSTKFGPQDAPARNYQKSATVSYSTNKTCEQLIGSHFTFVATFVGSQ